MNGSLVVAIPFKGGPAAKSRLAPCLPVAGRLALARAMLQRVAAAAAAVPAVRTVLVVTSCPEAAALAREAGTLALHDREDAGTAAACHQARAAAGRDCAMLFLNADLPFATADALARLAARAAAVVVAPDRARIGTNALLLPAGSAVEPCFGARSFPRHLAAADAAGEAVAVFDDPAIAFDVDEPDDLRRLGRWGGRHWARELERA